MTDDQTADEPHGGDTMPTPWATILIGSRLPPGHWLIRGVAIGLQYTPGIDFVSVGEVSADTGADDD